MRTVDEIQADAAGKRPFSNHSEFDYWASDRGCYECVNDDDANEKYCPILSVALLGSWPAEWTRKRIEWKTDTGSGSYEVVDECTEFEQRPDGGGGDEPDPDPGPSPVADGQLDLIDAYLDTAIGELSRAPVMAEYPGGES